MAIKTEIIIAEKLWKKQSDISKKIKSLVKKIIPKTTLNDLLIKKINLEISVLLTGDKQITELNKNYRHKNKPTNVLSFPLLDSKKIKNGNFKKLNLITKNLVLGDIALSYQTIFNEATNQKKSFDNHLTHLILHSILHLIGFDHEDEKDAKIMESLEVKILADMGIGSPY